MFLLTVETYYIKTETQSMFGVNSQEIINRNNGVRTLEDFFLLRLFNRLFILGDFLFCFEPNLDSRWNKQKNVIINFFM